MTDLHWFLILFIGAPFVGGFIVGWLISTSEFALPSPRGNEREVNESAEGGFFNDERTQRWHDGQ